MSPALQVSDIFFNQLAANARLDTFARLKLAARKVLIVREILSGCATNKQDVRVTHDDCNVDSLHPMHVVPVIHMLRLFILPRLARIQRADNAS